MQLNITGNHIEVNPQLRSFLKRKLGKIERHHDRITSVHVVLSIDRITHRAEATVHALGNEIYADASATDMQTAIDSLVAKLDRQILKHKEKLTNHRST